MRPQHQAEKSEIRFQRAPLSRDCASWGPILSGAGGTQEVPALLIPLVPRASPQVTPAQILAVPAQTHLSKGVWSIAGNPGTPPFYGSSVLLERLHFHPFKATPLCLALEIWITLPSRPLLLGSSAATLGASKESCQLMAGLLSSPERGHKVARGGCTFAGAHASSSGIMYSYQISKTKLATFLSYAERRGGSCGLWSLLRTTCSWTDALFHTQGVKSDPSRARPDLYCFEFSYLLA